MNGAFRILVVDDSPDDCFLARHVLRRVFSGCDIQFAHDGVEALERLGQDDDFDLLLLDINMPRMNGHEFLKAWTRPARRPAVVVLTSSEQAHDRESALSHATVDSYLVKPITKKKAALLTAFVPKSSDVA